MLNVGSIKPSLIDESLLQQVSKAVELKKINSPLHHEIETTCVNIILFIKKNIYYIIAFIVILGYAYYCYKQHEKTKTKKTRKYKHVRVHNEPKKATFVCDNTEKQMLPGDYVQYGNKTEILQRPIAAYPSDEINAGIRRYWLSDTNHTSKKHIPRHLEMPKLCNRQPTYENSMSNIYGQPVGPMMPPSQYSNNNPLDGYEDTYYQRTNAKFKDCSDDYDDQFYSDSIY